MNKHERYVGVCKQMEMLKITDVTTNRQHRNGTRVWRLPIKYSTHNKFIEVASFKTGYVRNQNGGYTNYQLNKRCDGEPEYHALANGDYRKYTTRSCVLIPNEIDRLEYLIAYCLKNYYIKLANQVIDGKYVSKWEHEYMVNKTIKIYEGTYMDSAELEEKLEMTQNEYKNRSNEVNDLEVEVELLQANIRNLENKLATIERIANDRNKWNG